MRKYTKRKTPIESISDERAHEVVTLHRDGVSKRAIARALGLGAKTTCGRK